MATEMLEAIFEQGSFSLLHPQHTTLREGQRVRLVVTPENSPDAILAFAASVYHGFSAHDIAEIEQIARHRESFFGERS